MSSPNEVDPQDIYPMPTFLTFQVPDLDEAQRYYTEVLGFRTFYTIPMPDGSPAMHHMRRNRYQDILLVKG
ncbi:MAG TPA: VOC family protein, partial [Thermomicrobiaceae bacterium]|nr:VOC family protein [Thermomicrobiaceae bacterium]